MPRRQLSFIESPVFFLNLAIDHFLCHKELPHHIVLGSQIGQNMLGSDREYTPLVLKLVLDNIEFSVDVGVLHLSVAG